MCFCGTSRACLEFSFTEEDIKIFVVKLQIATKRLFAFASNVPDREEKNLNRVLSSSR
jgi:hypothetical protein